jgi:hypothetical protein
MREKLAFTSDEGRAIRRSIWRDLKVVGDAVKRHETGRSEVAKEHTGAKRGHARTQPSTPKKK